MFQLLAQDGDARLGTLTFKSGNSITTPFFMPVATKGTIKTIPSHELKETKTECVISNSLVLYLRPGLDVIEAAGGYRKFAKFDGPFFTDSGGFQMIQRPWFLDISKRGIHFRNPYKHNKLIMTPELSAEIQESIASDVAMILDDVVPFPSEYERAKKAVQRTKEWTERFLKAHSRKDQLVFAITQGSVFADLRRESAEHVTSLDVDGYAIGGLAFGEPLEQMNEMIKICTDILPKEKPRYKMGVGSPLELLHCVSLGIDCFDSRFPTQNARRGRIFTKNGFINMKKPKHAKGFIPLDESCKCNTCKNHSRAFLYHLLTTDEKVAHYYLSFHNVFFMQTLIAKIREAIKEKRFAEFKKSFEETWNVGEN